MNNNAIRSDDPQAVEKLREKLTSLEKQQGIMKAINSYYRKNETCFGFLDLPDKRAAKLDERVRSAYSWEKQPYPQYALTNNSAEIRRLKKRIDELTQNSELGFVGWKFEGGEVVANNDNCRLQVFFDEKPDEEKRTALKFCGFRWAPSEGAWQRQLNSNAIYAASRMNFIRPENGESPLRLQPKAPSKDSQER